MIWELCLNEFASWWFNDDHNRRYAATLASRSRGFTQSWGANDDDDQPDPQWFLDEEEQTGQILARPFPSSKITLFQYQISWKEMWALQASGQEYTVVNSEWTHHESCGSLPCWKDDERRAMGHSQRSIWEYLKDEFEFDINSGLSPTQSRDLAVWEAEVEALGECWNMIKYRDDWELFYKKLSYRLATKDVNSTESPSFTRTVLASYQISAERRLALGRHSPAFRGASTKKVLEKSEAIIERLSNLLSDKTYMMGTSNPTTLDVMLWDVLMCATAHIGSPLRKVVERHDNLVRFCQTIYQAFFDGLNDWDRDQVEHNPFFPVYPIWEKGSMIPKSNVNRSAIARDPYETWNRWRYGGAYNSAADRKKIPSEERSAPEKAKIENYRRQDEYWLGAVVSLSLAMTFGMQVLARSEKTQ